MTEELLEERLMQIIAMRGKRGTKMSEQITSLRRLMERSVPFGPKHLIPLLMHVVSSQFDLKKAIDSHMHVGLWRQVVKDLSFILRELESDERLRLGAMESDSLGAMAVMGKTKTSVAADGMYS
jgi:hypothetical protein